MNDVTRRLQELHAAADTLDGEKSEIEITVAELWCNVLDNKTYKDEGCKSVSEYIELVGAGITRQYVYNLADCWRCGPVRNSYIALGPQKAIAIAKAHKQDKITWDDAQELANKAASEEWTVKEVKDEIALLVETNQEDDNTIQGLLDEQAELIKKRVKLQQQLDEVEAEIEAIQEKLEAMAE